MFSFLLSNLFKHMRFMVSKNSCDLIFRSKGDSVASDGDRLTSISQGFMSLSSKMSKPSNSKQLFLCVIFLRPAET